MDDFEIEKAEPEPRGIRSNDFWWGPLAVVWLVLVVSAIVAGFSLVAGPSSDPVAEIAWWCRLFGLLVFSYLAVKMASAASR